MCEVMSAGSFSSLSSMFPYTGQRGQFLAVVRQGQGVCVCVCVLYVCVGMVGWFVDLQMRLPGASRM